MTRSIPLAGLAVNGEFLFSEMTEGGRLCFGEQSNGVAGLWRADSGELVTSFQGPEPPIRSARVSSDGHWISVTVERESVVHLFDVVSHTERQLRGHRDFVSDVAFSPDCRSIATASMDGTIKLWDCSTGTETGSLTGHMQEAEDVSYSPDGRTLASIEQDQAVKLWHLGTLREVMTLKLPDAGWHLQFAPDGGTLVMTTSGDTARLLRAPSFGECMEK
jgi:WD40 repeat protein